MKQTALCRGLWIQCGFLAASVLGSAQLPPVPARDTTPPIATVRKQEAAAKLSPVHKRRSQASSASATTVAQTQTTTADEPQPGIITLQNERLTIQANNSDLRQLLGRVSALNSMKVEGTVPTEHIFGTYGPGKPSEVLTELLAGTNYNVLMAGITSDGLPRELILTSRTAQPSSSVAASQAETNTSDEGEAEPLGPGAIAHVPPNETEDAVSPQNTPTRVQQNLQRLQRMQQLQNAPQ